MKTESVKSQMKKIGPIIVAAILLAGCQTPTEQAIARQEQYNSDAAKCESYGARRGGSDFIQCMATIESGRHTIIRNQHPSFYPTIGVGYGARAW